MKIIQINKESTFRTGNAEIRKVAGIELEKDELVTFRTTAGGEYDIVRKSWGFYATPSLNERLKRFRLRAVLAKNSSDKYFVLIVEKGKETDFEKYLMEEHNEIVCWLDDDSTLKRIEQGFRNGSR